MKTIIKILVLVVISVLTACSSKSKSSYSEYGGISESQEIYREEQHIGANETTKDSDYSLKSSHEPLDSEKSQEIDGEKRKRIYSGYLNLMVREVKQTKHDITMIVEESGGYVEQILEYSIIIRVPAEHFFNIFQILTDYDEVISKSIETYDVTESFKDIEGRLEVAKKTRERLYSLLEKTDNVKEKLKILQEIRRLTEEIEHINSTLEVLKNQISYSRITIDLSPRFNEEQYSRQEIPFSWIAMLNPLYNSLDSSVKNITLELDDNFAVFDKEKHFIAESSDGTIVRIGKTDNRPEGDLLFWQKALSYHLSPFYKNTVLMDIDTVKTVLFESKDKNSYFYLVGIYLKNEFIYVLEVFFPHKDSVDENLEGIKDSLRSFEIQ